ncbi:hypothetical protein HR059_07630 [Sinorhizobium meliloti WSM1022]|uniref:hypothetical protein n=1 Tax=Rhizobium meliloti TaxID=382 RepID=UPI00048A3485|nr:hypothetical protein [Sinorhizobium meliloti]QKN14340.1 hypothetical protein HR059_07630 [Sinorhizobium meliloti WSM1022]
MAPLPFNLLGSIFESGIDALRESFISASQGLQQKVDEAAKAVEDYQTDLANDGEWIGERDPDEGHVIWDQEQVLEFEIDAAREAHGELRKAYAVAAYHYWERSMRKYCKDHKSKHPELVQKAIAEGFPISLDLNRVHRLANALKHNSDSHGTKLQECWPEVISVLFGPRNHMNWYAAIALSDAHVHQVFDIIRESGPRSKLAAA